MARQLKDKKKSGLGGLFSNDAREKTRASRSAEQAEKRTTRAADRAISRVKGEAPEKAPDTVEVFGKTITLTDEQKKQYETTQVKTKETVDRIGTKKKTGTGPAPLKKRWEEKVSNKRNKSVDYAEMKAAQKEERKQAAARQQAAELYQDEQDEILKATKERERQEAAERAKRFQEASKAAEAAYAPNAEQETSGAEAAAYSKKTAEDRAIEMLTGNTLEQVDENGNRTPYVQDPKDRNFGEERTDIEKAISDLQNEYADLSAVIYGAGSKIGVDYTAEDNQRLIDIEKQIKDYKKQLATIGQDEVLAGRGITAEGVKQEFLEDEIPEEWQTEEDLQQQLDNVDWDAAARAKARSDIDADLADVMAHLKEAIRMGDEDARHYWEEQQRTLAEQKKAVQEYKDDTTWWKIISNTALEGLAGVAKWGSSVLNFLAGEDSVLGHMTSELMTMGAITWNDTVGQLGGPTVDETGFGNVVSELNRGVQSDYELFSGRAAEAAQGNNTAEFIHKHLASFVQNAPFILVSIFSAPATATTAGVEYAGSLAKSSGFNTIRTICANAIRNMAEDPATQYAFVQSFGDNYEEAKAEIDPSGEGGFMVDFKATMYALVNSYFNAMIETGGGQGSGIETYWDTLQGGGTGSFAEQAIDDVFDEIKEEELQGFFERGLKSIYQAVTPFSLTDENAIVNPGVILQTAKDTFIDTLALMGAEQIGAKAYQGIASYDGSYDPMDLWNAAYEMFQNAEPEDASFGRVPGQAAPGVTKPGSTAANQTTNPEMNKIRTRTDAADNGPGTVDPKEFARQVVEEQAEEEQGPYKVKPVRREAAVNKPGVNRAVSGQGTDASTGGSDISLKQKGEAVVTKPGTVEGQVTDYNTGGSEIRFETEEEGETPRNLSGEERAEKQAPEGRREETGEELDEENWEEAQEETEENTEEESEEETEKEREEENDEETEEQVQEEARNNQPVYKDRKHNAVYQVAQTLGVSEQAARTLADGLDIGTVEAPTYTAAVREVVQMAEAGYSPAQVMQNSELAQQITPTQFERAYQIGAELKGGEAEVTTKPKLQNAKIKDLEPALASLGEYAEEAAAAYEPGQDVGTYAAAMNQAIGLYAAQGMDFMNAVQQARKSGGVLGTLTGSQLKTVRDIGKKMQADKKAAAAKKAQQRKETREKAKAKGAKHQEGKVTYAKGTGTVGGVRYHAVDQSRMTSTQKAVARIAEEIARVTGLDVRIADFGRGVGGEYFRGTGGTLFLNINAKYAGRNIAIGSLTHELVHFLQEYSEDYAELKQAVLEEMARNPEEYEGIFGERARVQPNLTPDELTDEMVANALQKMLMDQETVQHMVQQHRGLMERIRDFFNKLIDDIKAAFSEMDFESDFTLNREVKAVENQLARLRGIFDRAFSSAVENLQAEKAVGREAGQTASQQQVFEEEVTSTEVGDYDFKDFDAAKGTDGNPLFQVYAFEHDEPEYREMLTKWGGMSKTQVDDLFNLVDHAMEIIKGHLEELDYAWETDIDDRSFQPVKQNSDKLYKVSQDFSTLCRKRILQGIISGQLSASLQRGLTKEEGIAVRDALMAIQEEGKQIEVACALCYVESARMRSQKAIQQFLNDPAAAIQNYYAGKSGSNATKEAEMAERQKIWKEYGESLIRGKGDDETMYDIRDPKTATMAKIPTNLKKRIQDAKNAAKKTIPLTAEQQRTVELAKSLPVTAFTTPEGLQDLAKNSDTRDIFNAFVLKVSAASKSKGIENDTWWRAGDSKAIGDALIQQMNAENGLRTQSWSDFQVKHLMDYIAATIELSTRGAQQHAYTKVLDYVELMGDTGVMINMSLIPTREFNGSLEYDDVEGFKYKDAMRMREKFPDTAGTICIGMDDEQVRQLLASTDIDYVIPYHQSGMSKATRAAMHIPAWKDFQNYQGEKKLSRAEARANAEKYGVQLLSESDPLWHESPNFSDWYDLSKARQTAKKAGKTGEYGVMSGGYAAMQEAAENYKRICAQRGLAPKFSYGKADFSNEPNYWKLLIDRKMVNNVNGEIIEQKAIKPIFDFDTVQRILDDELERYGTVKADQEEAIERVTQAFLSGKVKGGMSSEQIAKAMQKPVDNVPIVNITENAPRITAESTDEERYEILKNARIRYATADPSMLGEDVVERLVSYDKLKESGELRGKDLTILQDTMRKLATKLKINTIDLENSSISFPFRFSNRNVGKSTNHQKQYSGSFTDLAKALSCIHDLVDGAQLIETHTEKKTGTTKENRDLKQTYVLLGAMSDGSRIIPVELVVKEFYTSESGLYMTVTLSNIEDPGVVEKASAGKAAGTQSLFPESTVSIQDLIKDVNAADSRLLKYFPDQMLSDEQKEYKKQALERQERDYDAMRVQQQQFQAWDEDHNNWAPTFYSKMSNVVNEWTNGKGQPLGAKMAANQVVGWLKGKGVKAEEIRWSGIVPWLEGRKTVTQQELQQVMAGNEVKIETVVLDDKAEYKYEGRHEAKGKDFDTLDEARAYAEQLLKEQGVPASELNQSENSVYVWFERNDTNDIVLTVHKKKIKGTVKWSGFTHYGGENYREVLFKMPSLGGYQNQAMDVHWEDTDVIAHARIQDMVDRPVAGFEWRNLYVDELQSDLHNEGANKGYATKDAIELQALAKKYDGDITSMPAQDKARYEQLMEKLVPTELEYRRAREERKQTRRDAHKALKAVIERFHSRLNTDMDTIGWSEMAWRRILFNDVSETSISRWLRGEAPGPIDDEWGLRNVDPELQENAAAELRKDITSEDQKIFDRYKETEEKTERLGSENYDQRQQALVANVPDVPFAGSANTYHEYVMKNLLRMAAEGDYDAISWSTADMQIERWQNMEEKGYGAFRMVYDQNIPKFMSKYVKQWGAKVEQMEIPAEFGTNVVWGVRLNDAMKQSVLHEGQPLFQRWDNAGEDTASEKKGREVAYARLQSENAILKDAVKSLKKLSGKQATTLANIQKQLQLTKTPETRLSDARKLARAIVQETNSEANVEHVAESIKALGDYLLNTETGKVSEETLKGRARAIASEVLQGATEDVTLDEETMEVNPYEAYMGEAVEDLANRITMDAMSGLLRETAPTKADKAKARTQALKDRIQNLRDEQKLSQREAASLYQTIYDLSVQLDKAESRYRTLRTEADYRAAQIRAEGTARAAEIYARERARAEGLLKAQRETYQRMAKQARELRENSAQAAKYRKEIEKKVQQLQEMLIKNDDKVHVPEVLKDPLGDFLATIDLSSKSLLNQDTMTKADEKRHSGFLRMLEALENQQRYIDGEGEVQSDLGGYLDISQENLDFLRKTASLIYTAMQQGQTYTINRMNAGQLKQLSDFLSNLRTAINNMNEFMANARFESVKEAASADVDYMKSLGKAKEKAGSNISKFLTWENGVPYYVFKRFGAGGQAIFDGFTRGWEKMARNAKEIIDFTEKAYKDSEVKSWKKQTHDFTLSDGSKITMTTAQIMELSQLLGREQALKHIEKGGVRIGTRETKKGKATDTTHYHFTQEDLQKIVGALTPRQLEVAKALQKFMADKGGVWGNEVSMRRFGYNFYTEGEHYYPIMTDQTDRPMADTDAQKNSMFRLLNLSASKSLNPKASNALVVNDIFDTFSDHMADMAKLNGMGLPILDAIKWFNYKERVNRGDGTYDTRTIQSAMEQAFGGEAGHYFRTLMKDINGQTETGDRGMGLGGKFLSNYKAAAVGANLRVAMLQPTSYVRARTVLKQRYLAGAFFHRNAYKEAMKYSGTAIWKSLGYYDTDISKSMRSQIVHDDTFKDKLVERSMRLAELGDKRTWGRLWVACKMQTRAETGLTGEALNEKTADLFREVIYSSQVMDATLTRSEIMRGKGVYSKINSAFMAEPTLSYNILMDAVSQNSLDKRAGKKNAGQRAARLNKAILVYVNSAAFAAFVESLADAARDDDDEEFWDKFLQAFLGEDENGNAVLNLKGNFAQDLSILGKLPIIKNFVNNLQGYNKNGGDMTFAGFSNLVNAYKIWEETWKLATGELKKPTAATYYGNMTGWGKLYKTLQALSQLSGVPYSNQTRDVVAIWNTFVAGDDPEMKIRTYDSKKDQTFREKVAPAGVTKAQYNTVLDRADMDGSGSVSQAELADTLQRAINAGYVTEKQARAIWSSRFEKSWEEGLKAAEKAKEEAEYEASHPGYTAFKNTAPVYSNKKQDAYKRYQKNVKPYGISIDTYTDILIEADTGNGSVTQDELGKTLRKKIRQGELSYEEAEAIWGTLWHGSGSKTYKKWARSN